MKRRAVLVDRAGNGTVYSNYSKSWHFMKTIIALLTASVALATGIAARAESALPSTEAATARGTPMTEGEVRKVDKEAEKLTLRHAAISNLDMPAMTMVFRVSDPGMLANVQVGQKVRFRAEKVDGQLTITRIEASNE